MGGRKTHSFKEFDMKLESQVSNIYRRVNRAFDKSPIITWNVALETPVGHIDLEDKTNEFAEFAVSLALNQVVEVNFVPKSDAKFKVKVQVGHVYQFAAKSSKMDEPLPTTLELSMYTWPHIGDIKLVSNKTKDANEFIRWVKTLEVNQIMEMELSPK
jgi:hypothetical protein